MAASDEGPEVAHGVEALIARLRDEVRIELPRRPPGWRISVATRTLSAGMNRPVS
mgnify:CR=1 FL=1